MSKACAWLAPLWLALGCGARSETAEGWSSATNQGGTSSTNTTVGGGGSSGGSVTEPTWLYETDDEGAFPQDRVLDIQVTMDPAAFAQLIATAEQEIWSVADVTIDGQALGTIGIRPKGAYSLDSCVDDTGQLVCDKLSLKLKFNEVNSDLRFYGLKKLALNNLDSGWSMFREPLAYGCFRDFGITAPRTSFATVTVNGNPQGIYTVVEVVDGRFTDRHFDDGNGNLYKEAWPERTDTAYFAEALETNEATATHEGFIAFASAMLSATDDALPATLGRYTDLQKMLDYMAVDYAVTNWDGITTFYAGAWGHTNHNYYMYQSEDALTFTLIPWDLNATFLLDHWLGNIQPWDTLDADCSVWVLTESSTDLYTIPSSCDPTIRAIALSKEGYHAAVQRLLDEVFTTELLSAHIDAYVSQVSTAMQHDPFIPYEEMLGGAEDLKAMVGTLRARLEAVLVE